MCCIIKKDILLEEEMKTFEISGNLKGEKGLGDNYRNFVSVIYMVRNYYVSHLGESLMDSIGLYIDNAVNNAANNAMSNTGHTPIITPILGKYLIIKLGITQKCSKAQIAFQFAHELMHFVFFAKYGIDKKRVDEQEEAICTAASLIVLHNLYTVVDFDRYNDHVQSLPNSHTHYRKGTEVAKGVDYNFKELIKKI